MAYMYILVLMAILKSWSLCLILHCCCTYSGFINIYPPVFIQVLWLPAAKNWLIWKDLDVVKDWRQEEKGTTGNEMVGWHHWHNGHEFETLEAGNGQGGLACCSPWVTKGQTWLSNWTELSAHIITFNNKASVIQLTIIYLTSLVEYLKIWGLF